MTRLIKIFRRGINIKMEATFQTHDYDLAAYLFARAYPPVKTRDVTGKTLFIFSQDAELSAEAFYYGASISAKRLLHALRELEGLKEGRENDCTN
jgi:hypothetical protein